MGSLASVRPSGPTREAGAIAGLLGGVLLGAGLYGPGIAPTASASTGGGVLAVGLLLVWAAAAGALYAAVFAPEAEAIAASLSSGLLYGLLWWILGPLTVGPLLRGQGPTWSLAEAVDGFPSLVGHLVFGATLGIALPVLHRRRGGREEVASVGAREGEMVRRRILILGGGFGGVAVARRLEDLFWRDPTVEIDLVSRSNYLLFTPLLAEVASGALLPQHVSAPLRASLPRVNVHRAEVVSVDLEARAVLVAADPQRPPDRLAYDHLVLALGSVPSFHGLPGVRETAFTLKSLDDAVRLHDHVVGLLESARVWTDETERRRRLTFVVVGGGFAGAEIVAELYDLVATVLPYYPEIDRRELRFLLVHGGPRILPEIGAELAAYALGKLQARGIEVRLGTHVVGATPESVRLDDGTVIPTRTLVWAAGNRPNPLLGALPCPRSRQGGVLVDGTLRVPGYDNVWALGDGASVPDPFAEGGGPCPPTAQHAVRQGRVLAENIARSMNGRPLRSFRYRSWGTLVGLGHRSAVAELRGLKFSGRLAWFLWRTVYLLKLPGLDKKLRVALDWTVDLFFPRDIVLAVREREFPVAASRRTRAPAPGATR